MNEVKRLAREIREQNKLYEAGETDRAFWLGQKCRLEAIKEADPNLTQVAIGKLIGKSDTWISTVQRWDSSARELPDHRSGSNKRDEVVSKALKNPQSRLEALASLTKRDLEDLAVEATDSLRQREASTPSVSRSTTPLDEISAEVEILSHIHRAVRTAQRHGKERFLIKRLQTVIDRLEMESAAASPKEAVAELEQWLAGQV